MLSEKQRMPYVFLAALTAGGLLASSVVRAQEAPVQIDAVRLRNAESQSSIEVRAQGPLEWTAAVDAEGRLVVDFPRTVPGPQAVDQSLPSGLVAMVEVGFFVPEGVPTTRLVVRARQGFTYDGNRGELIVTLRIRPGNGAVTPQTQSVEPQRAQPVESAPPARPREVERTTPASRITDLEAALRTARREAATYRDRAAELHEDRLRLAADLRDAKAELAQRETGTGADNAEATAARTRVAELESRIQSLESELTAARRSQTSAANLSAELDRLQASNRALEQDKAELAGSLEQAARELEASEGEARTLRDRLGAAAADSEDKSQLEQAAAQARTRVAELERELAGRESRLRALEQQSEEWRQRAANAEQAAPVERARASAAAEARFAALLAQAPGFFGAEEFLVADRVDPCLNLRPQPNTEATAIDCLPGGSAVRAIGLTPDWLHVRLGDGREGWVSRALVVPAHTQAVQRAETEIAQLRRQLTAASDQAQRARNAQGVLDEARRGEQSAAQRAADLERTLEAEKRKAESLSRALQQIRTESAQLRAQAATAADDRQRIGQLERQLSEARSANQSADAGSRARGQAFEALGADAQVVAAKADPCLSLRSRPSTVGEPIDCLVPGTRITVVDYIPEWVAARLADGRAGWLAAGYLEPAWRLELRQAQLTLEQSVTENRGLAEQLQAERQAGPQLEARLESARAETARALQDLEAARQETRRLEAGWAERRQELIALLGGSRLRVRRDTDPCVRLRSAAGTQAEEVDCLVPSTAVNLLALDGGWLHVQLADGRDGWAAGRYFEPQASRELEALQARLGVLESQRSQTAGQAAELDQMRARVAELERQAAATSRNATEAEQGRALAEQEVRGLRRRIAELEAETGTLEAEAADRAARVAAAEEARAAGEAEIARLQDRLQAERAATVGAQDVAVELDRSRARVAELEGERESLRARLATLLEVERERDQALDQARQALAAGSSDQQAAEQRLAEAAATIAAVEQNRNELVARTTALESELSAMQAEVERLRRQAESTSTVAAIPRPPVAQPRSTPAEPVTSGRTRPAEPVQELPMLPTAAELEAVVRAWAAAWSEQRVDDYLAFYSAGFQPAYGVSRPNWVIQRRERLTAPTFIEIGLGALEFRIDSAQRASAVFSQSYRSNTFQDQVTKTLDLVMEEGRWKIAAERAENPG